MVDISGGVVRGLALGVSPDGLTVVGQHNPAGAFVWHTSNPPGAVTLLPLLPGETSPVSNAYDTTNNGERVVGTSRSFACLWTRNPDGAYLANNLNTYAPPGWNLTSAASISENGARIAGQGLNPQGQVQAWVITLPTCNPAAADFNGDGDTGTDQDIEAFFACLAGNCCATCCPCGGDINNDGDFGTDQDIEAFFQCLAGNCCS
jgi:hypothetical protein